SARPTCRSFWESIRPPSSGSTWRRAAKWRLPGTGFPTSMPPGSSPAVCDSPVRIWPTCFRKRDSSSSIIGPGPTSLAHFFGQGTEMLRPTQISIPTLVRVKDGALDRLGLYLARSSHARVALFVSQGLLAPLQDRAKRSLAEHAIEPAAWFEIA